jgi:predicted ATP-grasp superfamily ATP-dependent carboligase
MKNYKNINLILTSFSTRAAADCFSTLKNLKIYSFDYFGDLDLKEIVDYSYSLKENKHNFKTEVLFEAVKKFLRQNQNQEYDLIYASAWDNHPELLYQLEKIKNLRLRGNSAAVISKLNQKETLKNLFKLAEKAGFKTPDLFLNKNDFYYFSDKIDKDLIIKPYQSGGGLDLKLIKAGTAKEKVLKDNFTANGSFFAEEFIKGNNRSCQFAADGKKARILSFTQELKADAVNPKFKNSFKYAGNILTKEDVKSRNIISTFINELVKKYSLQGINGIDYIKNEQGIFFIELNPRFTAAVELIKDIYREELLNIYLKNELAADYLKKYLKRDLGLSAKVIYYTDHNFKLKKLCLKFLK